MISGIDTEALARSDEIEIVSGVLAFADRPVRELMTPRTAIVAIPEDMPAAEGAHVFAQSGYSYYPVYRGSLDQIVGVAHTTDLLGCEPEAPVPMHQVVTVPGPTRAAELMGEMQRGRGHLAVVLDEYGGTAGLVTLGDLLKDLVAEVFDTPAEPAAPGGPTPALELEGTTPVSRLEDAFAVPLDERRAGTVGGLLVKTLGRIPRPGERFVYRGLEFDVIAATATRVERVVVRRGPVRPQPLDPGESGP
jgi:CBS domain containing-hemolysin-like protein